MNTFQRSMALASLVLTAETSACSVPVFRYALERWQADNYELRAGAVSLPENLPVNLVVTPATAGPARLLLGDCEVWSGKLDTNTLAALLDSPARREMVRRLVKGDSVVWLVLESGDKNRDDRIAVMLAAESRKLEKELELPPPDPDDPRINPNVPLKIAFSILRIARGDPAEHLFVTMLLQSVNDPKARAEPVVLPVFGRGRALCALVGEAITQDNLGEVAGFLTGACSCEVKAQNPGKDLLMTADWDALLEGRAINDPERPPLIGLSQLAAQAPAAQASLPQPRAATLTRNLIGVIGLGIVAVMVGTLWLRNRSQK